MVYFYIMNSKTKQPLNGIKTKRRHSYLLRLWRTEEPANSDWQASLEVPGTGERIGFANLEQLFAYLMDLGKEERGGQGTEDKK